MPARFTANEDAPLEDEDVWTHVEELAGKIARTANETSARIGITYNRVGNAVRIGPRGAAAIAVEYGSVRTPAKRYVKRALDRHRIG